MGSGKTTAGRKLARLLKWSFIDLDEMIEKKAGKTISKIFSESGEEFFRKLESEELRNIDTDTDTVISVGGGAPCFADNMEYMKKSGLVVYLKMKPADLISRLKRKPGKRPLLKNIPDSDLLTFIEEKLAERESYYNLASVIAEGKNLNVNILADIVNIELKD